MRSMLKVLSFCTLVFTIQSASAIQITANTVFIGPSGNGSGVDISSSGTVSSNIYEQDDGMAADIAGNDLGLFRGTSFTQSWIGNTGHPNFSSRSSYSWENTFTNTGSIAQDYFYTLNVDKGFLALLTNSTPIDTSTTVFTKYNIDVLLNGTSIWNSSVEMILDSSGYSSTQNGTFFGGNFSNFTVESVPPNGTDDPLLPDFIEGETAYGYQWNAFNDTINLGTINAGEDFTLTYLALLETGGSNDSNFATSSQGYIAAAVLGDPATLSALPANMVSTVPVPGAVWLFLSGLCMLLFSRKRV